MFKPGTILRANKGFRVSAIGEGRISVEVYDSGRYVINVSASILQNCLFLYEKDLDIRNGTVRGKIKILDGKYAGHYVQLWCTRFHKKSNIKINLYKSRG